MMDNIEWKEGAVCFAEGREWTFGGESDNHMYLESVGYGCLFEVPAMSRGDFQLNEIRQGDYIEASELDTEQKYNDAVEVFGLFGFGRTGNYMQFKESSDQWGNFLVLGDDKLAWVSREGVDRKITYSQLMAIGKLKRTMIERDGEGEELKFPSDFMPKDGIVNLGGVDVNVKWDLNNLKCQVAGRVVNVDDFGNLTERDAETVCGKPKEDFEKATDKAKSLQQDFSSEQAILDCKDLDINVVFTGEGIYILDCINSVEYQLESVDEYNKVVSAIRLLQSKER